MATTKKIWKKGRGKLGILDPLIGTWTAQADSPMGSVRCRRTFSKLDGGAWVLLDAVWEIGRGRRYSEHAVYGVAADGTISFWSFTSDGKRSEGHLVDGSDIHPEAISFEAQMAAGLARMTYWPGDNGTVRCAVESKTKKGWNRFTEHVYRQVG